MASSGALKLDLIYDVSRLSTRTLNLTPNGIDWIDSLLADYFISGAGGPSYSLLFGFRRPRLFEPRALYNPVPRLDRAWGRDPGLSTIAVPDWLAAALHGDDSNGYKKEGARTASNSKIRRLVNVAHSLRSYAFVAGSDPSTSAPRGAAYLNASHFPLEQPRHVAWLERRPDIRPVFFIHDLLPVLRPELFWSAEPERHARRLELLARRGAGAIVTSRLVAEQLRENLTGNGRENLPILTAAPPVVPAFRMHIPKDPRLNDSTYFVVCGTIEPRKNHMLLFEAWRRLVARHGRKSPKLLVVGKRGWHCDEIVAAMQDPVLRGAVVEARGLSTGAYRAALASACALLSPSFAEGFGLPVAEALAAGIPAIVSDIPPHREQGGNAPLYLDPRRVDDWVDAIEAYSSKAEALFEARVRTAEHRPVEPGAYLQTVSHFLQSLT